uniref:uncharacterized protein si:ch211-132b12.7 isoform X1 n=1 Tax=Gasterosteus aculeatus aculeatus TaxID=481459 RepID=UPI001A99A0EA|nr:uncharacterized protein si:ch211-132b12.7 isoform X1 [Gasterosteus aculeatus aculeatus]XP_040028410.1 uncharacterized protein si:ch211-132b12.7 isoform X1 [Gasterosteus aculeatus aculeatus]XP_040028412.1 uncharacterized protein si:ch211-132b12.7 isoform X1 [Gasterosteus aculeatus aculeatus]XP_040028413.1 uncharacterized protein si:ch211-132b12.7 isoform X1 [Gasterosteus aculeatus aculeatus]
MPKEQQHGSCASSSKNAKNKSNRTTLLAMRDARDKDASSGTSFRCSSEKDSGYSDGQQIDVEDQDKSQRRGGERAGPAQTGRNEGLGRGNPGRPSPTPAGGELPPIYIINNIVIQQGRHQDVIQNRDQCPQRSVCMEDGGSAAARVILAPATRQVHGFFPSSIITGRKINGTYRLCERPRSAASSSPDRPSSSSPTTGPVSQSTPPGSAASSVLKTRGPHGNGSTRTRQLRFHDTAEILRQSGLLDITLRTKELLRQSNATARDVAQLRRHTELLCRAVSDPGATPEQLHQAMAESGSYPGIEILRNFQIPDSSDSEVPSAGLLRARGPPAEKDRFTPPDSSTG